jgi:hypothetical protein
MKMFQIAAAYLLLTGCCVAQSVISAKQCGTLSLPRERHGSFFFQGRLYVMGGKIRTEWSSNVQSAAVDKNGMLGTWRDETPLPDRRSYLNGAIQVVGNHVYVIGGNVSVEDSPGQLRKASHGLWTKIQRDGTLGAWAECPDFPGVIKAGVVTVSTAADDKHLLITGGSGDNGYLKDVFICDLAADGTPGPWRTLGALPVSLWYNGTALIGERIYVYGGLTTRDRSSVNFKVYSAAYDGATLSAWRTESKEMFSPLYSSVFCSTPRCLVAIGGRYANDYGTTAMWYAPLVNGQVQEWRMSKTDLQANVYIAGAVDRITGRCFISGGQYQTVPKENSPAHDAVSMLMLPGE